MVEAQAFFDDGRLIGRCVVRDVSGEGALLQVSPDLALPAQFRLRLESRDEHHASLKWRRGASAGVRLGAAAFGEVATGAERLAVDLQWLRLANDRRNARPGVGRRLAEFRAKVSG
jgi:hypothetical protein